MMKDWILTSRVKKMEKVSSLTSLIQQSTSSSHCSKARIWNKRYPNKKEREKERNLFLFADNMFVYVENLKESTKTQETPRFSNFSNVTCYTINTEKSITFLYAINECVETKS